MVNTLLKISLLLFISFAIVQANVSEEKSLNDLDKQKLKGRVKSVMEMRHTLLGKGKNVTKDRVVYQKLTLFNEYGYESEVTLYKGGAIYLISRYNTGIDGKQLEMNEYNADGTLNLSVSYKYDDKGFKFKGEYKWADSHAVGEICENTDYYYEIIQNDIFTKVIYKNDYRGLCLEENYLRSDSTLSFKIENKYDFRGNKLELSYYHGNGRLSWMTKNNFDRYDNMIGSRIFKSNYIAVQSEYEYQFDDTGNWTVRKENRDVYINILTEGLEQADMITERTIEYY
jgi:hypothetical protein